MILIRPRAWWYNKVPLSVMLFLLLVDGKPLTGRVVAALFGLIAIVCCVANYGYALNEVFDLAEDRRGGRKNIASEVNNSRIWTIILISGITACCVAALLSGTTGFLLTACELLLPLAYSIPPLRVKERGWWGVFADALAAHVYPALLALLIVSRQTLGVHLSRVTILITIFWALATGLRGILSHQLQSDEHDRRAGLLTVVHQIGHARLKSFVVLTILPVEILCLAALIVQSEARFFLRLVACLFLLYEAIKFRFRVFPVIVFNKAGEDYIPFVDEGFYKVWGLLVIATDAAFVDLFYLGFIPLCCYAFWPRVAWEKLQIALTAKAVWIRLSQLRHPSGSVSGPNV